MIQKWNIIRIFISSTFRDMHAERDHLVKVVFPELRERCAKRRLHLIDVDLRWGVTEKEAEQGKVLEIILDAVERSRPFFIGILGERYGSIPDDIPEDAKFAHPWLQDYPDHSITALEIIHGVLRNQELAEHSFFYFRDPQFISKIPDNIRGDYIAENSETTQKLAALKDKIRSSNRPIMENYPCRWDDSKESIVDLDVFGQQVLEDLWTAIKEEYSRLTIERQIHEAFVEERSHLHVGREEEAAQLTKHVQSADQQPVVITGESGCGKSAFLATWYKQYVTGHPDEFVLAYFIGVSPDSTDHLRLLRNMCKELKSNFNLEETLPKDDKKLSEVLMSLLLDASKGRRIVILLDALDQLSAREGADGLGWLLDYLPANVHLVVSSLGGNSLEVLRRRGSEEIALQQLTTGEQRQIVHAQLSEWGHKLDEQQISALLAHPGVENPLYLRVALEELRLFRSYDQLTERIMKWKTARVFVCSTFADMAQEREKLEKLVFPQLRKVCQDHSIQLVDVDLNWGLANEPSQTKAILQLADSELNQASICLALLGERFGTIPDGEFDSWLALCIYSTLSSKSTKLLALRRNISFTENLAQLDGPSGRQIYYETRQETAIEQHKLIRRLELLKVPLIPYGSLDDFTTRSLESLERALEEMFFSKRGTVFISYSRKNIDVATQLMQMLESAGFAVWLDLKGIALGDEWLKQISEAIATCDAVIFLVSNESVCSNHVFREISYAILNKKPVLPYHLEPVELPGRIQLLLGHIQHIEASSFKSLEDAFEAIVSGLSRHVPPRGTSQ